MKQYHFTYFQDAPEDLLVSHLLKEHNYCNADRLQFNKKSGKYLPRSQEEENRLIENLVKQPIDLEDLKYLKSELEEQKVNIKWTPHPVTKFSKKVKSKQHESVIIFIPFQDKLKSGCARTEGFFKYSWEEKLAMRLKMYKKGELQGIMIQ